MLISEDQANGNGTDDDDDSSHCVSFVCVCVCVCVSHPRVSPCICYPDHDDRNDDGGEHCCCDECVDHVCFFRLLLLFCMLVLY